MHFASDRDISRRTLLMGAAGLMALPALAAQQGPPKSNNPRRITGVTACPVPEIEKKVPTKGGNLYARANGMSAATKLPVVFLHGGPGGSHLGMVGALPLADSRPVILYDQLDCGYSDRPGDRENWTVERFTSEIDSIRDAFGLDRFHLSGTSWGGTLALEYAARRPKGLESLILLSPLVSTRSWLADAQVYIEQMPEVHRQAIAEARRTGNYEADAFMEADLWYVRQHLSREKLSPLHLACQGRKDELFNLDLYMTMWGPSEFVVTGTLAYYDGEHLLPEIEVPTLFAGGEHDEARPSTLREFARRMPNASYKMVPGSGHWVENDRPVEHNKLLRGWLADRA